VYGPCRSDRRRHGGRIGSGGVAGVRASPADGHVLDAAVAVGLVAFSTRCAGRAPRRPRGGRAAAVGLGLFGVWWRPRSRVAAHPAAHCSSARLGLRLDGLVRVPAPWATSLRAVLGDAVGAFTHAARRRLRLRGGASLPALLSGAMTRMLTPAVGEPRTRRPRGAGS
jgi:hypothetical protein